MTAINYKNWSHMDVVNWLISLHFDHLVPNFEQMQIDGAKLATLSDQDLRQKLRICKPSELLDLKEAIDKLEGDEFSTVLERQTKYSKSMCASRQSVLKKRSTGEISYEMSHFSITWDVSPRHPKNVQGSDSKYLELIDNTKLVAWSAFELIDMCIYSGWIRKKGSKKNNWKKRFLVLRLGCLYYFKNEVAPSPKGSINLSGYKAKICIEDNIVSKCPYTLKLIPTNPQVRTYYFSFGSQKELEGWKEAIDSEIMSISPSESVIYESPKRLSDDDDSDDDPYTKIDESYSPSLPSSVPTTLKNLGNEATYLAIVDGKLASDPAAAQPDLSKSPVQPPSSDLLDQDSFETNETEESEENEDDNYYIMFRRFEEIMPPSCIFDQLDRVEADRLLKEAGMDGIYLIRGGSHNREEKVLSVWHVDKCYHYRLLKNENSLYSLDPNQAFKTIPELLQYYTLQQKLPHLEFYLENPYRPSQD